MTDDVNVPEHYQVATTSCICGDVFPSLFLLDTHLYGDKEAVIRFHARFAALDAIEAKAIELAVEDGDDA